ncbi:T4 superinfection immunity protein [Paraburkholderia sp. BL23I1N1]|uniref:superinfection immunity protein n=1 Tax=Paraburkholderia sp. BL23I1N1 TaxID=1938802 RepID=UPI000E75B08E|nr:superinfection immunity protein [Paraburkholderia sp. BL23I1N1]RKE38714.1 T4 superinfection immunity protein [Paraburkholderia sp. BL23I1N1]
MLKIIEGAVFLGALVLYLVPAMIADAREREDAFAVTIVNILLGWTVIGWFAALVWARHPVSDRRLKHFARRAQRAVARVTIDAIVARAESRAGSIPVVNPRLVPLVARIAAGSRHQQRG